MAETLYPFSITKRKDSSFYMVRFKDETTGKYLPGRSTGKKTKKEAIKEAFKMLMDGSFMKKLERKKKQLYIRNAELDDTDLVYALGEMKRRGLLSSYTLASEVNTRKVVEYLEEFWDWEKSPYIKEKLRQGHTIHQTHALNMRKFVGKYWKDFFGEKTLGELTKARVREMFDFMADLPLSGHTKNSAIRAVTTALKFAHSRELIEKDLTEGLVWFAENYSERKILSPELARAVFSVEWSDRRAKLANMVAMCTGMRAGEIRALRVCDIGGGVISVAHSWNDNEGLKEPKNGEARIVQFPFPRIEAELFELQESSPFKDDGFIFFSTIKGKPIDSDIFVDGLRDALEKTGMTKEEAKGYVFHSWRHFFATYLSYKLEAKLLQRQTGHKTRAMLEHYASHRTDGEAKAVISAQLETFANIIPV